MTVYPSRGLFHVIDGLVSFINSYQRSVSNEEIVMSNLRFIILIGMTTLLSVCHACGDGDCKGTVWGDFLIKEEDSSITICGFSTDTPPVDVQIPTVIHGKDVTVIGSHAFCRQRTLRTMILPSRLLIIEEGAFYFCTGLKTLIVPQSVRTIGDSAFSSCENLESVVLPEGLAEIVTEAFSGCTGLTTLTVPPSVKTIGDSAFSDCTSLKTFIVPSSVLTIGESAFSDCKNLESIVLFEGLTEIKAYAFSDCIRLKTITLPQSIQKIGESAFRLCSSLETITIPSKVKVLELYLFERCTSLKSVKLSYGVEEVEYGVFNDTALTRLEFPDSIQVLVADFRLPDDSLEYIRLPAHLTQLDSFIRADTIVLPDKLQDVNNCSMYFQHIEISQDNPMFTVKNDALYSKDLTRLFRWPKNNDVIVTIPDHVQILEEGALRGLENIKQLILGENIVEIKDLALRHLFNLEELILPESLVHIGAYNFSSLLKVKHIHLPKHVNISDQEISAFHYYRFVKPLALESISVDRENPYYCAIDDALYSKDATKFIYCPAQKRTLSLPLTLTKIDDRAFSDCRRLESIHISVDNPFYTTIDGNLYNKDRTALIYHPSQNKHKPSL